MKRIIIWACVLVFIYQAAYGQSKVAVLDASLGIGVHPNAASIVADTINEQFVKSPDYIAIDRTYISSIQAEKAFQLSGEVDDRDIKELGVSFGADFLCIPNVNQLGSTFTVSARLIEVESAQVVAQESHRMTGEIDVLFEIAEVVGGKFLGTYQPGTKSGAAAAAAGRRTEQTDQSESATKAETVKAPAQAPAAAERQPENGGAIGRFSASYFLPGYFGEDGNDTYSGDSYYSFYEQDQWATDSGGYDNASNAAWGIDIHIILPFSFFYFSTGAQYSSMYLNADYYDPSFYETYEYEYEIFNTLGITIGAGFIVSPVTGFQLYGGATIGYMVFTLGTDYDGDATATYWADAGESAEGLTFGGEAGADLFLGPFCLSVKYALQLAPDLTGDLTFTDSYEDGGGDTSYAVHGLTIGLGIAE